MWDLLLLDLDGTLVDSRRDIATAVNRALAEVAGISVPEARIVPHIGGSLRGTFVDLAPGRADADHDAMVEAYKAFYFDHCADHSRPYPGVIETLGALAGVTKAIATTKRTFMALRVAEALGLAPLVDLVQGTDDGTPIKPAPDLFLSLIERFGARPARTLAVGDTVHDVGAGKAAGCVTVAVTYGIGTRNALAAAGPDRLVDSFAEVGAIVDRGLRIAD
jgi:HAD superfamily hydrolase (TIGR01509 family)